MHPSDWQNSTDPLAMLDELFPQRGLDSVEPQTRQSRLYLIACGRLAWGQLPGVCRAIVAGAERAYAGQLVDRQLRNELYPHAESLIHCRGSVEELKELGRSLAELGLATPAEVLADADIAPAVWSGFAHLAFYPFYRSTPNYRLIPAHLQSADLVRDVFGSTLGPLPQVEPGWRTDNVMRLTRHIDSTSDYSLLPILADALQDAGCERDDVLAHLRGCKPHVRGCWVIERLLGGK